MELDDYMEFDGMISEFVYCTLSQDIFSSSSAHTMIKDDANLFFVYIFVNKTNLAQQLFF